MQSPVKTELGFYFFILAIRYIRIIKTINNIFIECKNILNKPVFYWLSTV